jgi:hypothetical protein
MATSILFFKVFSRILHLVLLLKCTSTSKGLFPKEEDGSYTWRKVWHTQYLITYLRKLEFRQSGINV